MGRAAEIRERWRGRRPGWLRRTWARHPRMAMALRAAVASAIAWYVGRAMPEPLGNYPYYAPMGAVVATSFTLTGSVRESIQTIASIALGAGIALAVEVVTGLDAFGIAVAVALGVLASGWRLLGSMGSWVVTGALFTLVFSQDDAAGFVGAYAGLTAIGAVIGVAVTWLFPAIPLAPAQDALRRVQGTLVDQLRDLAEGLDQDTPPDAEEWASRRRALEPLLATMRAAVGEATEAARGNRRVNRYTHVLAYSVNQSRALELAAFLVEDLNRLLMWAERADNDRVALGPALRPTAARALARLADALRSVDDAAADPDAFAAAERALDEFVGKIRREHARNPGDAYIEAGSVATTIGRCLESVRPG